MIMCSSTLSLKVFVHSEWQALTASIDIRPCVNSSGPLQEVKNNENLKKKSCQKMGHNCLQEVVVYKGFQKNFGVMDRWLPLGGCHLRQVVMYM